MGAASKEIGTDGSGTTGRVQSVSEDDDASDGASSEVGKGFLNKVSHKYNQDLVTKVQYVHKSGLYLN